MCSLTVITSEPRYFVLIVSRLQHCTNCLLTVSSQRLTCHAHTHTQTTLRMRCGLKQKKIRKRTKTLEMIGRVPTW